MRMPPAAPWKGQGVMQVTQDDIQTPAIARGNSGRGRAVTRDAREPKLFFVLDEGPRRARRPPRHPMRKRQRLAKAPTQGDIHVGRRESGIRFSFWSQALLEAPNKSKSTPCHMAA